MGSTGSSGTKGPMAPLSWIRTISYAPLETFSKKNLAHFAASAIYITDNSWPPILPILDPPLVGGQRPKGGGASLIFGPSFQKTACK